MPLSLVHSFADIFWLKSAFMSHILISMGLLCIAATAVLRLDMWHTARLIVLMAWLALCALFPLGPSLCILAGGFLANHYFMRANLYKISQNHMPITASDIAITLRNPGVLFHLFGYSDKWLIPVILVLSLAGFSTLYGIIPFIAALSKTDAAYLGFLVLLFVALLKRFEARLYSDIQTHFSQDSPFGTNEQDSQGWQLGNWQFEGVAKLSVHLGLPAFLLYSRILEQKEVPVFFQKTRTSYPVTKDTLIAAAKHIIPHLPATSANFKQPNIVVVQCESIFNPSEAFNLSTPYTNSLFIPNEFTKCLAPLRVNIVGGGSWVSEFELVTGLDIRLFGYIGYYAHVTLSPYAHQTLPDFLNKHGYDTKTYFSVTENFYNAKSAYLNYGFKEFVDANGLGLSNEWYSSDIELAGAFINKAQDIWDKPFFTYIISNGAHSPYSPDSFWDPASWKTRFAEPCEPLMNATLNEYIRLSEQTESGINAIAERLLEIERVTGRPFVLIAYGDHQPHEFIGTWGTDQNYDAVRSNAPRNQTFVHIMSSMRDYHINCTEEIPLPLVSSFISSAVTGDYNDLYALPNFYLQQQNGSDFFPNLGAPSKFGISMNSYFEKPVESRHAKHYDAQETERAIEALRKLDIITKRS